MVARRQVAALPLRRTKSGALEVLLVTSRGTGRWIIPKGWPSKRLRDRKAAAREAREEAGVKGKILPKARGLISWRQQKKIREPDLSSLIGRLQELTKGRRRRAASKEKNSRNWRA